MKPSGTMNRTRRVEPEWLDELPTDDPRAMRSRRDLTRINDWMLQARIMARSLSKHADKRPRVLLDLGAGDGTFMLRVARRIASRWPNITVILLDRQNIVRDETRDEFSALHWKVEIISEDAFRFLEQTTLPEVDILTANLFLHHFTQEQLARLLAHVARLARLFVACEPQRSTLALVGSRLLWAIGCNEVTRHDAVASVQAGFTAKEITALWPNHESWDTDERAAGLYTHCFVARRLEHGSHRNI